MSLTIIGDVHGHYAKYERMARKRENTVQIGDLGFKYDCLNNLDPNNHKLIGGNHDNYDIIAKYPHYLGDFGNCSLDGKDFFFYRGAFSIDRYYRTIGIDWWQAEQVNYSFFEEVKKLYVETKPDLVLTHDCPSSITPSLLPTNSQIYHNTTSHALEELFKIHQPKMWLFGHYHVSKTIVSDGTKFICLDELETLDI